MSTSIVVDLLRLHSSEPRRDVIKLRLHRDQTSLHIVVGAPEIPHHEFEAGDAIFEFETLRLREFVGRGAWRFVGGAAMRHATGS